MYQNQLKFLVSQDVYDLCMAHISTVKELRLLKVMNQQMIKFEKLWQKRTMKTKMAAQTRNIKK